MVGLENEGIAPGEIPCHREEVRRMRVMSGGTGATGERRGSGLDLPYFLG